MKLWCFSVIMNMLKSFALGFSTLNRRWMVVGNIPGEGLSVHAFLLLVDCSTLPGFLWEWRTWKSYREGQMEVLEVSLCASQLWTSIGHVGLTWGKPLLSVASPLLCVPSPLCSLSLVTWIFVAENPHCHHWVLSPFTFLYCQIYSDSALLPFSHYFME